MAERVRPHASGFNEPEGPGAIFGADLKDQTIKLVAISSLWVTAGEYCKVNRRSEEHWPRTQTKSGVHPYCGFRALEMEMIANPTGLVQRASPMETTLLLTFTFCSSLPTY